jgi:hypothetical protein
MYSDWCGIVSRSIFFYKIVLWILFTDCGPGYNLKWWWSDGKVVMERYITLSYILAHNLQTEFKEEFYKGICFVRHAMPIKMHKIIE